MGNILIQNNTSPHLHYYPEIWGLGFLVLFYFGLIHHLPESLEDLQAIYQEGSTQATRSSIFLGNDIVITALFPALSQK